MRPVATHLGRSRPDHGGELIVGEPEVSVKMPARFGMPETSVGLDPHARMTPEGSGRIVNPSAEFAASASTSNQDRFSTGGRLPA
jgi:hypothetical protein